MKVHGLLLLLMSEMGELIIQQGRSLAETPTYLVASVVTVMVFVCLLVERSIYRFGKVSRKEFLYNALFAFSGNVGNERIFVLLVLWNPLND